MRTLALTAVTALLLSTAAPVARAADNALTDEEKAAGWQLLFNGRDYDDWFCMVKGKRAKPKMTIEDGCLVPLNTGGYLIMHKDQFEDFILKCDVKPDPKRCNSGLFFRVSNPNSPVQNGFEMQVSSSKGSGSHNYGAIYDLAKPKVPIPEGKDGWDAVVITCKGPMIEVEINGAKIIEMNCAEYTEPRKNPDGSKNKFSKAIKDFESKGYIGFQDHGDNTKAWYKNIKVLNLKAAEK